MPLELVDERIRRNEMSVNPKRLNVAPGLEVRRVAGRIGAEIGGVRLSGDLDARTIGDIRYALLHHKVVFFRGQQHLDDAEHEAFAELLGTPAAHPTLASAKGTSYILELDAARGGRANQWHTDVTFLDRYPAASILRALVVPSYGGDTVWANTATAYNDLTAELRDVADRLWAVHSNAYDYAAVRPESSAEDRQQFAQTFASTVYETEHPVVAVHPETNERTLLLGGFVQKLVGQSREDSTHLYSLLQSRVTRLENTVRWRWEAGDVAIWDNRATQHYAINDYGDQHRVMRRVTIQGEVAVGIDGRRSAPRAPRTS
jgi:alpha-ketoglutarate-dependent sulfate ester dioxygenase